MVYCIGQAGSNSATSNIIGHWAWCLASETRYFDWWHMGSFSRRGKDKRI